jgi:hypothetical protein
MQEAPGKMLTSVGECPKGRRLAAPSVKQGSDQERQALKHFARQRV